MFHKSIFLKFLFFLLSAALFIGCNASDINKQNSVTSGTTSGSGNSGGSPANVIVYAASNSITIGATTTITVIITDGSGKRTDASVTLTSSRGGTFNGSNATLNGNTVGGIFVVDYKATNAGDDEVTVTIAGTILKGNTVITAS